MPSSEGDKYLAIYLNDHLSGATAGLELARRAQGGNDGSELGVFLTQLVTEIDEDREVLQAVMGKLDVSRDSLKVAFGWAAEKAGRLKLNGQVTGYSPLSRVLELEGLALGVLGKASLWRMLGQLADPRLSDFDFDALLARAERQHEELDERRIEAGRAVFEAAPRPTAKSKSAPAAKPKPGAKATKPKSKSTTRAAKPKAAPKPRAAAKPRPAPPAKPGAATKSGAPATEPE